MIFVQAKRLLIHKFQNDFSSEKLVLLLMNKRPNNLRCLLETIYMCTNILFCLRYIGIYHIMKKELTKVAACAVRSIAQWIIKLKIIIPKS